jgi:thiamine pyrophosphate-dependent acetolactate synthase large subunit-like protein
MAESLGCYAEYVEDPSLIRPALERAFSSDCPALVNVLTDWRARATTAQFSVYST